MIKNNTGANYDQDEINYQQNLKKIFYNTISALEEKLSKLKDKKRFKDKNRLNKAYQYYFADLQDSLKKHPDLKKYYRKIISQHPKVNAMLTACEENLGADKNQQNAVNQMNFFQHSSDCKIGNMLVFKAKNWKITYENQIFKVYFSQQAYEKYQYIVNKDPSFRIATLETFKETTNFKIEAVTSLGPNPKSAAIIFIRNKKNTSGLLTLGQLKISELFHPYNNKQGQAANKLLR